MNLHKHGLDYELIDGLEEGKYEGDEGRIFDDADEACVPIGEGRNHK